MGCCCSCCCVPTRKTRREIVPDLESRSRDSIGQPPPYDFKNPADESNINGSYPVDKAPIDPPAFSERTTIDDLPQQQQEVKVGVRSRDHRLYQAAAGGHLEEVKRLLESGFNPSDRTVFDWCPLHWAAQNDIEHGHEIVKLLVRYGADINQVSDTGVTPLDLARKQGKEENVRFLEGLDAKTGVQMREERKREAEMRLMQNGCIHSSRV